jgi:hypothetical protein
MAGDVAAVSCPLGPNGRHLLFGGFGIIMLLLGGMPIMIMPSSAVPMIGSTSSKSVAGGPVGIGGGLRALVV